MACPIGTCRDELHWAMSAKSVLEAHDLVLISEFLGEIGFRMYLSSVLHFDALNMDVLNIGGMHHPPPPSSILLRMQQDNQADLKLYTCAKYSLARKVRVWFNAQSRDFQAEHGSFFSFAARTTRRDVTGQLHSCAM